MTSETKFTVVFNGDIRKIDGNPHKIESPFGRVQTVSAGDLVNDPKRDAAEDMYDALIAAREHIVNGFRHICPDFPEQRMAGVPEIDAALAKARGEQ